MLHWKNQTWKTFGTSIWCTGKSKKNLMIPKIIWMIWRIIKVIYMIILNIFNVFSTLIFDIPDEETIVSALKFFKKRWLISNQWITYTIYPR